MINVWPLGGDGALCDALYRHFISVSHQQDMHLQTFAFKAPKLCVYLFIFII